MADRLCLTSSVVVDDRNWEALNVLIVAARSEAYISTGLEPGGGISVTFEATFSTDELTLEALVAYRTGLQADVAAVVEAHNSGAAVCWQPSTIRTVRQL